MRDLRGNFIDLAALLLDHMLLDLTHVWMDCFQDVVLGLGQLLQLDEQGILPGGDAVYPLEADDPRTSGDPCQSIGDGVVIHGSLLL